MTANYEKFYINGAWVEPISKTRAPVINPAIGESFATVALADEADVARAVAAAKAAFPSFSRTSLEERLELLERIAVAYERRRAEIAEILILEAGFPRQLAHGWQVGLGTSHFAQAIETLKAFPFDEARGTTRVRREPIGVAGLITPWNWPINQIVCKVAPALAVGNTTVLKPSELSPLNAVIFAEILDEAGVPPGVFNLINGDGATAGAALSAHPDVDVVSFTGSTRAGVAVATAGAATVKRILQELGGKSPFIALPDAPLEKAVSDGVAGAYLNVGQTCNAPTRLFVPRDRLVEAERIAAASAERFRTGEPDSVDTDLGPLISETQWLKVQRLIQAGIDEGAKLVTGGVGKPRGLERGYYVRPTVFSEVKPEHTIFREEIFGPVLSITPYNDIEEAIELANDTIYGLAGYVHSADVEAARAAAGRIRAGTIYINSPAWDSRAPFGGYKASGNGREYADFAFSDFTEIKGVVGWG
jgi:aldehyde dehydrogenase (NAD+)